MDRSVLSVHTESKHPSGGTDSESILCTITACETKNTSGFKETRSQCY